MSPPPWDILLGIEQTCASCGSSFEVTDSDLAFYKKISPVFGGKTYEIPPPKLCPDCRRQRRFAFRNERNLYRRTCDATGKSIISIHSPDKPYKVFSADAWWSDQWDPLAFGRSFDFSKTFFEQFSELYRSIPQIALANVQCENCEYVNQCGWSKNCYMAFLTDFSEECHYTFLCASSKNCMDSLGLYECELCYECIDCTRCYSAFFCRDCSNCSDCFFSSFCRGCRNCFGCTGLRNAQYYWYNEKLTEHEWKTQIAALRLDATAITRAESEALHKGLAFPRPHATLTNCEHCTGDYLSNCKNAFACFDGKEIEDSKYIENVPVRTKDTYDITGGAGELLYECFSVGPGYLSRFCGHCWDGASDLLYCMLCMNGCKNLFGCIGLKKQSYCILNKQYTNDEYEKLAGKIIEHMQRTPHQSPLGSDAGQADEWGEFFPVGLSPFAYNETPAQEHFPLSQQEVLSKGWKWKEVNDELPYVTRVINADELPDTSDQIPDDIVNWAIACATTKRPFRIIKQELEFYRRMKFPVPRLHPDERHRRRLMLRNPRRLWSRACAKCSQTIQTTFSPDRPETVYCEKCYMEAIY